MAVTGTNVIDNSRWDKGQILLLQGTGITTGYQYSEVQPDGAPFVLTTPPMQYSGASRQLALYVFLSTANGSPITTVTVDVEVCHEDPTQAINWAQVLSQVHQGTGPINVDSAIAFPGAPLTGKTVLVTCTQIEKAKHVRVGAKANQQGVAGDLLKIFAVAW